MGDAKDQELRRLFEQGAAEMIEEHAIMRDRYVAREHPLPSQGDVIRPLSVKS